MGVLWLRSETKHNERRTPLTPEHTKELVKLGHAIVVEKSKDRIYTDKEFEVAGCYLTAPGSWINAPENAYILGLKELPNDKFPLKHKHIYFAHIFKGQTGANELLMRFLLGAGMLYDIEYLRDSNDRVASFGYFAGIAGAIIALYVYSDKSNGQVDFTIPQLNLSQYQNALLKKKSMFKDKLRILIIGYRGRCGRGVQSILNNCQIKYVCWGRNEVSNLLNRLNIFDFHIVFNCIQIKEKLDPFITGDMLKHSRKLSIICDISCDVNNKYNPLPIYDSITTFENPTFTLRSEQGNIDIIAIDHLPNLLPKESSDFFSQQFFPHIRNLLFIGPNDPIWKNCADVFYSKLTSLTNQ